MERLKSVEQKSWGDVKKSLVKWGGKCAMLYLVGRGLLFAAEPIIQEPVEQQGDRLNTTLNNSLDEKSKKIDAMSEMAENIDGRVTTMSDEWGGIVKEWEVFKSALGDLEQSQEGGESEDALPPQETTTTTTPEVETDQ